MRIPDIELNDKEAAQLAEGIANVARHYELGASQKMIDWANLLSVAAMVYGSRIYTIMHTDPKPPDGVVIDGAATVVPPTKPTMPNGGLYGLNQ
jgi:hypothetical protein